MLSYVPALPFDFLRYSRILWSFARKSKVFPHKKRRPEGRLYLIAMRVWLNLGVNTLFEDELLVFFELLTIFQALVLVLTDHLTT